MCSLNISTIITKQLPNIDQHLIDYIIGKYLTINYTNIKLISLVNILYSIFQYFLSPINFSLHLNKVFIQFY